MNWMIQPAMKVPMPHASHATVPPAASGWASAVSTPLTRLVARPSTRLPRVRYQALLKTQTIQASVMPPTLARASSTLIANTINGMPTKWVAMLRLSRWYSAYCVIRSMAGRNGLAAMARLLTGLLAPARHLAAIVHPGVLACVRTLPRDRTDGRRIESRSLALPRARAGHEHQERYLDPPHGGAERHDRTVRAGPGAPGPRWAPHHQLRHVELRLR